MTKHNAFDNMARDWDNNPRIIKMACTFADHIKQHVPLSRQTRALDFGCGTGQVSMHLQPLVHSVAMVDTSSGMLDILRHKIELNGIDNMHIHSGDLFQSSLAENAFELAYTLMALHHVEQVLPALERFHQLLKPGGYLCIGDLEPEDGSFHGEEMDVHLGFDPTALQKQLENSGFAMRQTCRMMVMEKPDKNGIDKAYPLFFLLVQKP